MSQKDKETHLHYIEKKGKFIVACSLAIFTPQEIAVLEQYGHWFEALTNGTLLPFRSILSRRPKEPVLGKPIPKRSGSNIPGEKKSKPKPGLH